MRVLKPMAVMAGSYLLGSIPSADLVGRAVGVGIRSRGTGNPGAANTGVVLGWQWGAVVAALDVGKGWAAAALGQRTSPAMASAAGTAAVVGHVFPVWSGFDGGKGVATSYGMVLGTFPAYALPDALVAGVAAKANRDPFTANLIASSVWTTAAMLWWRRQLPNLWGPQPTAALPVSAAAVSLLLAWRMRQPDRVDGQRYGHK